MIKLGTIWSFIRKVAAVELFVLILVCITSGLLGYKTLFQFGEALLWAGLVTIALATFLWMSQVGASQGFSLDYSRTVGHEGLHERMMRDFNERESSDSIFSLFFISGCLSLLLGILMQGFFK